VESSFGEAFTQESRTLTPDYVLGQVRQLLQVRGVCFNFAGVEVRLGKQFPIIWNRLTRKLEYLSKSLQLPGLTLVKWSLDMAP
jgi:hypothetical protein